MQLTKVTVIIVTWNSHGYLPDCFYSLERQLFKDFSLIVVDNGSNDGTLEFIQKYKRPITLLQNSKNVGFARANNQGIKIARSEYVLVLNPDVILSPSYLTDIIAFADQHTHGALFGGKLLKSRQDDLDPSEHIGGLKTYEKTDILDSTGLVIYKNRRTVNRGEGQKDTAQFEKAEKIFGISGACALYRKSALDDVMIRGEYFDQDFHSYKEDIDLSWRLCLYGWENWYYPKAVAYHHRSFSSTNISEKIKNTRKTRSARKSISKILKIQSLRNQHFMILKNEQWKNLFLHGMSFFWYEFKVFCYAFFLEPYLLKGYMEFFKNIHIMRLKRNIISSHRKLSAREMRKWFL